MKNGRFLSALTGVFLLAGALLVPTAPLFAAALPVRDMESACVRGYAGRTFPNAYDGRAYGLVTPPQKQEPFETCWAFAVTAAEEANLMKSGLAERNVKLSEYHLAYFSYRTLKDPLGNLDQDVSTLGDTLSVLLNYGGHLETAAEQLAKWSGPVEERVLPYEKARQGMFPDSNLGLLAQYHLKNAIFGDGGNREEIKALVLRYGAVATSYYHDGQYDNEVDGIWSFYIPKVKGSNHAVCIIGWDDSFPRDHFKTAPSENGAWLCKTSGGSGWADGDGEETGYVWISYDTCLTGALALELEPAGRLRYNYQYDGCADMTVPVGEAFTGGENERIISCMNVFQAKGGRGCLERLEAVSVRASRGETYKVTIYVNPLFNGKELEGYGARSEEISFTAPYDGIYRIDLEKAIYLEEGERFAVEVRGENMELFAASASSEWIEEHMDEGECYAGVIEDGTLKYEDLAKRSRQVTPRIKAYTNPTELPDVVRMVREISTWCLPWGILSLR